MHSQYTAPQDTSCATRSPNEVGNEVIQDPITCAELLKEISGAFTKADEQLLMYSIARGEPKDACVILCQLIRIKERIVERRKAEAKAIANKQRPDSDRAADVVPHHRTFVIGLVR